MVKKSSFIIAKTKALKYAKLLKDNMRIKCVYLFGSYAKKTNHSDSDT